MNVVLFTPYPVHVSGGFEKITAVLSEYLKLRGWNFSISKLILKDEVLPLKDKWVEPYNTICDSVLTYEYGKNIFPKISQWSGKVRIVIDKESYKFKDIDIAIVISPLFISAVSHYLQKIGSNAKIVTWFHLPLSHTFLILPFPKSLIKSSIFKIFNFYQEQLKSVDLHLSISSGIAQEIKMFSSSHNVKIVYNPVLRDDYLNLEPIKRSKSPLFAYIGRLDNSQKNLFFLFKGLSKLDFNWKLKIIGTGPDEDKLKNYAKKIGIEKSIEWLGFSKVPYELLRNEGVSALLLTSKFEGLPTVLIEAISYGIPVISSNCPTGPNDIVINGVNGFLYKPGSLRDFTNKITHLIENPLLFNNPERVRKTVEKFCTSIVCETIYKELSSLFNHS